MHVLVLTLYFPDVLLQEGYRDVAELVRQDELTAERPRIQVKTSVEYKRCLGRLEAKMQELMEETLKETPTLKECLPRFCGADYVLIDSMLGLRIGRR
jgi:hypothetical protein